MDIRLEKLRESLESTIEGMSSEQLSWHLPGKWCAAQVLEHLYLTYTGTIRGFEKVMASGKPLASPASMPYLTDSRRCRIRPPAQGGKAPAMAEPQGLPADKVQKEIGAKIEAMDAIITQCGGLLGSRVNILDHPILGPLNIRQWRKLHVAHGRHHQKQLVWLRQNASRKGG
jgi:hypothetical protein